VTVRLLLGCLIDFERREVIFSLNGRCLDPFRKLLSSTTSTSSTIATTTNTTDGYFAAASFMSYQHCRFNFGSIPFRYPPTTVKSFATFNDHAHLTDDEKLILPKYKKLELLRAVKINEHDCILCVDAHANILLEPCRHTGFCEQCALKLELCPICRTSIGERTLVID
jgi:RING finger and SPRY domain-containing protein 1